MAGDFLGDRPGEGVHSCWEGCECHASAEEPLTGVRRFLVPVRRARKRAARKKLGETLESGLSALEVPSPHPDEIAVRTTLSLLAEEVEALSLRVPEDLSYDRAIADVLALLEVK